MNTNTCESEYDFEDLILLHTDATLASELQEVVWVMFVFESNDSVNSRIWGYDMICNFYTNQTLCQCLYYCYTAGLYYTCYVCCYIILKESQHITSIISHNQNHVKSLNKTMRIKPPNDHVTCESCSKLTEHLKVTTNFDSCSLNFGIKVNVNFQHQLIRYYWILMNAPAPTFAFTPQAGPILHPRLLRCNISMWYGMKPSSVLRFAIKRLKFNRKVNTGTGTNTQYPI